MTTVVAMVLGVWAGFALLFCLAIAAAASRPMPRPVAGLDSTLPALPLLPDRDNALPLAVDRVGVRAKTTFLRQ